MYRNEIFYGNESFDVFIGAGRDSKYIIQLKRLSCKPAYLINTEIMISQHV